GLPALRALGFWILDFGFWRAVRVGGRVFLPHLTSPPWGEESALPPNRDSATPLVILSAAKNLGGGPQARATRFFAALRMTDTQAGAPPGETADPVIPNPKSQIPNLAWILPLALLLLLLP